MKIRHAVAAVALLVLGLAAGQTGLPGLSALSPQGQLIHVSLAYRAPVEPYMVNVWIVREGDAAPAVLRYSVASWRSGTASVNGVDALVAAMDGDNDGVFRKGDYWSVLAASAPDAAKAVLSHTEARPTSRLMFLPTDARELVLEFRSFSPNGRSIDFAAVDRPTTTSGDRAGDDFLASERSRPRATPPFSWAHDFTAALAQCSRF
jgi:hypothetical protein